MKDDNDIFQQKKVYESALKNTKFYKDESIYIIINI